MYLLWENVYSGPLYPILAGFLFVFLFFLLSCMRSFYNLDIYPFSVTGFVSIFSYSEIFILLTVPFAVQKFFGLIQSYLFILACALCVITKSHYQDPFQGAFFLSNKHLRNYINSLKSLLEDKVKGILPNSFHEASITLIPKSKAL